jgi:hypothetical protein
MDAVVNLAGENIFGRWTKEKKKRVFDSRVNTTRSLCKLLSSLDKPPKVLVSASATGYYGDRGDAVITEESSFSAPSASSPVNFLSDICRNWEEATQIARESGIRVVNLRLGIILSSSGGMLLKILPIFKLGLGGRIGNGNQYMSWIGLDDHNDFGNGLVTAYNTFYPRIHNKISIRRGISQCCNPFKHTCYS